MGKSTKVLKSGLTACQEVFCRLYASDKEFFGNGTESYLKAFDLPPNKYKTAATNASKLLRNTKILKRINEYLSLEGFNDENMDKQLMLVAMQNADYRAKVSAINLYGQLKKRIGNKEDENKERPIVVKIINFDGKANVEVDNNATRD